MLSDFLFRVSLKAKSVEAPRLGACYWLCVSPETEAQVEVKRLFFPTALLGFDAMPGAIPGAPVGAVCDAPEGALQGAPAHAGLADEHCHVKTGSSADASRTRLPCQKMDASGRKAKPIHAGKAILSSRQ